ILRTSALLVGCVLFLRASTRLFAAVGGDRFPLRGLLLCRCPLVVDTPKAPTVPSWEVTASSSQARCPTDRRPRRGPVRTHCVLAVVGAGPSTGRAIPPALSSVCVPRVQDRRRWNAMRAPRPPTPGWWT